MSIDSQYLAGRKNALQPAPTTAGDFIPAEEREEFIAFTAVYKACLNPIGIAEESCMLEVRSAAWRLRRCRALEAALPLNDPEKEEAAIKSMERARAHAHNITRTAMLELRRLQSERQAQARPPLSAEPCVQPAPQSAPAPEPPASFCKNASVTEISTPGPQLVPAPPRIPRGGRCPCHSGRKYKRCCGQNAPPVLHKGSKKAA